ncbi:STAS domain-containing protein [Niallia oryzisoli]|uniref:STAS domain-containing protein n=1 Tax=Niallia oryzisoli TaxID=1737571 RepID=A0ABZ2CBB7_9BACI
MMEQTFHLAAELENFLKRNMNFYTEEWVEFLKKNKSHMISYLIENGDIDYLKENCHPFIQIVVENISSLKVDVIMDAAREYCVKNVKTDFPIHLMWELFQSSRGFIWNAIKAFHNETGSTLSLEELFTLERNVNDIIDFYIDSYTAYYTNHKDELLKRHRKTVDELLVPIIPITQSVCILPLVGTIDTSRAKKIREKTLQRIMELHAQQLIIDVSGVPFVDTAVVNHLFKIVKGIKLLGCSAILTGISPDIANTMIELGIDVDNELIARADLQQALQDLQSFFKTVENVG